MRTRCRVWVGTTALVALIALLATVLVGCAGAQSAGKRAQPFNVLAVLPLSGPLALIGKYEKEGLLAAANVVNSRGGIRGEKVKITAVDDQGDGSKAVSTLQSALAGGTKYNVLYLGSFDQESAPMFAAEAKNAVLQVSGSSTAIDVKKLPYAFDTGTGFYANAESIAIKMKKDGITKFAIVCGDDGSGRDGATNLQAAAKRHGLTVTKTVFVPDTAADATAQVQQALGTGPQGLAVAGYTPADPAILKARTKIGSTLPVYGDAFFSDFNFAQVTTSADLQGVIVQDYPFLVKGDPVTKTKAWRSFFSSFTKYEKHPVVTLGAALVAYETVLLARAAANAAGSTDGAALAKAMPKIQKASQVPDWVGPKAIFSPTNHILRAAAGDLKFYKAGSQVDGLLAPGK